MGFFSLAALSLSALNLPPVCQSAFGGGEDGRWLVEQWNGRRSGHIPRLRISTHWWGFHCQHCLLINLQPTSSIPFKGLKPYSWPSWEDFLTGMALNLSASLQGGFSLWMDSRVDSWTRLWEVEDFILESKASRHWQWTGNSPKIDREAVLDQRRRLYYHLLPSRYLLWTTSKEIDRQEEALLSVNAVEFGFL